MKISNTITIYSRAEAQTIANSDNNIVDSLKCTLNRLKLNIRKFEGLANQNYKGAKKELKRALKDQRIILNTINLIDKQKI